jgi:hypothetical protein
MNVRSYALVTGAYWAFTITDGALRMLVLLHFAFLGYSPLTLGFLFLLYEFFGVLTNLYGGWLGTRFGLRPTLLAGLALQVVALVTLSLVERTWLPWVSVVWVMGSQALSGIAKDLTKMSSKSALKHIVTGDDQAREHQALFKWVAILTGSKNVLKGVGFFVGGALLAWLGFAPALWVMAGGLFLVLCLALALITDQLGRLKKTPLGSILSKSPAINRLSLARFFLFGARDIWFVVGLPLYLYGVLEWSFEGVGAFMAAWIIGYGFIQTLAPRLVGGGFRATLGVDPPAGDCTHRHRHQRRLPSGTLDSRGPGAVRRGVRDQLRDSFVPGPRLHRRTRGRARRGVLLLGECRGPPGGHAALRTRVSRRWHPRLPLDLGALSPGELVLFADLAFDQHQPGEAHCAELVKH